MVDWGIGSYEDTAAQLAPVSDVAVGALGLRRGERVLDVACGTGNAALVASKAGAPSPGSTRQRGCSTSRASGCRAGSSSSAMPPSSRSMTAGSMPPCRSSARSSRIPPRRGGEIARVVRPGGRVAITTWPPRGPMFAAVSLMRRALSRAERTAHEPAPTPRSTRATPGARAAPRAIRPGRGHRAELTHARATPEEFWDRWERLHPMWIGARKQLEPAGEWEPLRRPRSRRCARAGSATTPRALPARRPQAALNAGELARRCVPSRGAARRNTGTSVSSRRSRSFTTWPDRRCSAATRWVTGSGCMEMKLQSRTTHDGARLHPRARRAGDGAAQRRA